MPDFMIRYFARPYVAGDSIELGLHKSKELWQDRNIYSTLDLLGEEVSTRELVNNNLNTYLELVSKLKGIDHATISVKLSALGTHESEAYCLENMRELLKIATENNIKLTIDMEDHNYTDQTLRIYNTLLAEFPSLGIVLQSRLFRTEQDVQDLNGKKARIRICIGIYKEPKNIALQHKPDMKIKLIEYTKTMIEAGHYVEVATHDRNTINTILLTAEQEKWSKDQIEFQQLLGVPLNDFQQEIIERGYKMRLYVPFALDWKFAIPYLKRRLINNPKMATYVIKHRIFGKS
ncbi:MAG: proline dehydrogenase family protein [Candidatus Heimdallarchaeota archaeon]|nr:proline dehydrogenase family protein [Candidatus Heimdallarchaeota archaeon]